MENKKSPGIEIRYVCSLCLDEKKKEKVSHYTGGFCSCAHRSCMDIAVNTIDLYERYVLFCFKLKGKNTTFEQPKKVGTEKVKNGKIETYGMELRCYNCGHKSWYGIPVGQIVFEFTSETRCPICGCFSLYG